MPGSLRRIPTGCGARVARQRCPILRAGVYSLSLAARHAKLSAGTPQSGKRNSLHSTSWVRTWEVRRLLAWQGVRQHNGSVEEPRAWRRAMAASSPCPRQIGYL